MRYCSRCGKELDDDANFCSRCGYLTKSKAETLSGAGKVKVSKYAKVARFFMFASFVFNALLLVLMSCFVYEDPILMIDSIFCIIPFVFSIPMIIIYVKKLQKGQRVDDSFKILTLIFISRVAVILMLCDSNN